MRLSSSISGGKLKCRGFWKKHKHIDVYAINVFVNLCVRAIEDGLSHDGFDQDTPPMSSIGRHQLSVGRDAESLTQNRTFGPGQNQL
jgi:hypothetical protein